MGDEERFEPTSRQQAWLDSLSPERRHEVSDALHAQWCTFQRIAENTDTMVDLLLPHGHGERVLDFHMNAALGAEAFRALARGDYDRANELFDSAKEYQLNLDDIEIVVVDPGKRD